MNCDAFEYRLDEFLEGALADYEHKAAALHLQRCAECQRRLARVQALRAALRNQPIPAPRPGFFEQALARSQGPRTAHRAPWTYAVGAALAASLALWIGFGRLQMFHAPAAKPVGVTIALHETHTVQLAFNAERDLPQATLSITLPAGVELRGFPGQRRVTWQTNIARGANVLALPLIAVSTSEGTLLARLTLGNRSAELAIPLHVRNPLRTGAISSTCGTSNGCKSVFREVNNA